MSRLVAPAAHQTMLPHKPVKMAAARPELVRSPRLIPAASIESPFYFPRIKPNELAAFDVYAGGFKMEIFCSNDRSFGKQGGSL
jgi:hypothetical protein